MAVRSLGFCSLPGMTLPAGEVVALAPFGVALLRWAPVFMYPPLL